jgi:hypothetical protein
VLTPRELGLPLVIATLTLLPSIVVTILIILSSLLLLPLLTLLLFAAPCPICMLLLSYSNYCPIERDAIYSSIVFRCRVSLNIANRGISLELHLSIRLRLREMLIVGF